VLVETQQIGDFSIAPMADLLRFEPGIQPTLLLVQEAEKEHEGRLQLVGQRLDLGHNEIVGLFLTSQSLLALLARVFGKVDIHPPDARAGHAVVPNQLEQGPLALDVQEALQLAHGEAAVRLLDERPGGGHQVAVARKPHRVPTPQPLLVERRDLLQRIVLPPV